MFKAFIAIRLGFRFVSWADHRRTLVGSFWFIVLMVTKFEFRIGWPRWEVSKCKLLLFMVW